MTIAPEPFQLNALVSDLLRNDTQFFDLGIARELRDRVFVGLSRTSSLKQVIASPYLTQIRNGKPRPSSSKWFAPHELQVAFWSLAISGSRLLHTQKIHISVVSGFHRSIDDLGLYVLRLNKALEPIELCRAAFVLPPRVEPSFNGEPMAPCFGLAVFHPYKKPRSPDVQP